MQKIIFWTPSAQDEPGNQDELVTVIIPTYNRVYELARALDSVSAQTYRNYEIIVIDDASVDGTAGWVTQNFPEHTLITFSVWSGPSKARNEGIKRAQGKMLAFLDSDDQWDPCYLERQVRALRENPSAGFSFCSCEEIAQGRKYLTGRYVYEKRYPTLIHRLLLEPSFIVTVSAFFVRREVLSWTGLFEERLVSAEDRELYLRLIQQGCEGVYIDQPLVTRHRGRDSLSADLAVWADNTTMLLDLFFAKPENAQYKDIEKKARGRIGLRLFYYLLFCKCLSSARRAVWGRAIRNGICFGAYQWGDIFYFIKSAWRKRQSADI